MGVASHDSPPRADPRHGWLALLIPRDARRFRVEDGELRSVLSNAGGEIVADDAHVEVGRRADVRGDADVAVILLDRVDPRSPLPRWLRGVRRVAASNALGVARRRVCRIAAQRGYREVVVVPWERGAALRRRPGGGVEGGSRARRFLVAVAVVASRRDRTPTAFDAAVAAADVADARVSPTDLVLGSSGVVLAPGDEEVLRVSLGQTGRRLDEQVRALAQLQRAGPADLVADRVPWTRAHGTVGLASWSVERRLPGSVPSVELPPALLEQCVEFLVALHQTADDVNDALALLANAEIVAAACDAETARRVRTVASRAEHLLADVPRGFAHGDFWSGNLLVDRERLVGVVDWPSAGAGRLPLLDLLHLELISERERSGAEFGEIMRDRLLPAALAGGTDLERAYTRRLGLDLDGRELAALVGAYWLDELAHDLRDPDRDPRKVAKASWADRNVRVVLDELDRHGFMTKQGSTSTRVRA